MSTSPKSSPSALMQLIRTFTLALRLFFSPKVPLWAKVVPLAALAYIIFPFDFLPDVIPGFGQVDDLTILLIGIWAFLQLCPQEIVRQFTGESDVVDASFRVVKDETPATAPPDEQLPPADQAR